MTIARKMAQWVNELKYEDLPEKTIHEVKRRVIDSLATTFGAYWSRPARIARAKAMAVNDPPPSATVWGTNHHTPPDLASFANGTMVRYLDYNDTYLSLEPAHPSDNIPAAVATGQTAGKNGKDIILAIVIAYEIQCRLCDAASLRAGGWDHVTYGALSTALAAPTCVASTPRLGIENEMRPARCSLTQMSSKARTARWCSNSSKGSEIGFTVGSSLIAAAGC